MGPCNMVGTIIMQLRYCNPEGLKKDCQGPRLAWSTCEGHCSINSTVNINEWLLLCSRIVIACWEHWGQTFGLT